VAILARDGLPLSEPACGLPGEPVVSEARWCEATVAGVRIVSTYVPNGRTLDSPEFLRKLAFLDAMTQRARTAPRPLVVAGDVNIAPADVDVYDPAAFIGSTHVSAEERSRLEAVIATGLRDSYRAVHPDETQFTWWDYRAGHFHKGLGLRIDLALVSAELPILACGIERNFRKGTKPSDHAPLLVQLDTSHFG
jgi:exodeoxyribonuclease-3